MKKIIFTIFKARLILVGVFIVIALFALPVEARAAEKHDAATWEQFQNAITYVDNGGTINITGNFTLENTVSIFNKTFTITSEGEYTINFGNYNITVGQGADVTIRGDLNFTCNQGKEYTINVGSGGKLTIDGCTIQGAQKGVNVSLGSCVVIKSGTVSGTFHGIYTNNSTVEVTGGTVSGTGYGLYAINNSIIDISGGNISSNSTGISLEYSTAEISGGTIIGNSGVSARSSSTLNITDGSITANTSKGVSLDNSTVNISGGTIKTTGESCDAVGLGQNSTANISGGTITASNNGGRGVFVGNSTATISGDTLINANSYGVLVYGDGSSAVAITGGTILGEAAVYIEKGTANITVSSELLLSGGIRYNTGKVFISELPSPVIITAGDTGTVELDGVDNEVNFIIHSNTDENLGASVDPEHKDKINLAPTASGQYNLLLTAQYGETQIINLTVPVTVVNNPPAAKEPAPTQSVPMGDTTSFSASDIAEDADGDPLTITAAVLTGPAIVTTRLDESGIVTLTGVSAGETSVVVTVSDGTQTADITVPVIVTEFTGGNGSEENPYQIANAHQLNNIRHHLNSQFELIDDIDLTGYLSPEGAGYNNGEGWLPIGIFGQGNYFAGKLNGNNHTITGLYINRPNQEYIGLFGFIQNQETVIRDIKLVNVNISGKESIGSLVGWNRADIINCSATGNVRGETDIGGLLGGNCGEVTNCSFSGTVTGTGTNIGGLTGYHFRDINATGRIFMSCAAGTVTGASDVGGLVGTNDGGTISDSYSTCIVNGDQYRTGGFAGWNYSGHISNCYVVGTAAGSGSVGGFVGEYDNEVYDGGSITNCYYNQQVAGQVPGVGLGDGDGVTGLTVAEMKQQSSFEGWNFADVWKIDEDVTYPYLAWQENPLMSVTVPPLIATQPVSQTVTEGQTVIFTVEATGDAPLIYQWQKDGVDLTDGSNINGSTTATLTITSARVSVSGSYIVQVVNAAGIATSDEAILTVNALTLESIAIITPPTKTTYFTGEALDLTGLVVTGTYSNGSTVQLPITMENISGFDSSAPMSNQVIIVTYEGKTATFTVDIVPNSGGNTGSGTGTSTRTTRTIYEANISAGGNTLPISVNINESNAIVDLEAFAEDIFSNTGTTSLVIPSIPGVNSYTLEIPASTLSGSQGKGTLTLSTGVGNIAIPAGMLAGIPGTEGSKAGITIGMGDKTNLPEEVKTAIGERPVVQLTLTLDSKQTEWNNPNAPVTVSIPYTPTEEELANHDSIVVWYIDGSGNVVSVPNGRYDPATGTVTFKTTHFSYYAVSYKQVGFKDVERDAWHAKAIAFLAAREIITGTGNGNFSPEANLTRGQFVVMLMKAYSIVPDTDLKDNFADAGNTWYTGYLAAAKKLGISAGVGSN